MYGIYPYIYHTNQPNVGKYTIHGWYGIYEACLSCIQTHPQVEKLKQTHHFVLENMFHCKQQIDKCGY